MRRRRQTLTGLAIAAVATTLVATAIHSMGADPAPVATGGEGPSALSAHLSKLRQPLPSGDSPDGGAADAFLARAYPTGTIPVAAANAARSSFEATESRSLGGDDDNSATWQQLGPSTALYPFEPLRNARTQYIPNEYVAGGRTTSVALAESCGHRQCTMYITAAGGGVWRTDDALDDRPRWRYLGGPLGINAAGSVTIDPNDKSGNTVYVGTGEANICGSGCVAGVGIYRTRDGGRHWEGPLGQAELAGKGIGEITIHPSNPNVIYAATTTALRGYSSVCCFGVTRPVPGAAKWGLYKSTDGGRTWGFVHNGTANAAECKGDNAEFLNQGTCSPRGVREVKLDPGNPSIVYAASFARGVWRSPDAGATWEQIKPSLNPGVFQIRPSISINKLRSGATRMYVYEGGLGTPFARLFRSDSVATGTPTFADLTSANPADPGYATFNQCFGQCWYDVFVHTPPGHPDIVYTGGSYDYDSYVANHRGVVLSTDAGVTGTDMTFDGTSRDRPNALHPDQHDIVTHPRNPLQFWEASDGGVMRSSGRLVNRSEFCDGRGHAEPALGRCRQMLSAVPSRLESLNNGLNTLQFQSLSVSPHDPRLLQGGTQDNGTWQNTRRDGLWVNTMIGDGGQSGFDVKLKDFRFHTFQATQPEVNFSGGKTSEWIYIADPLIAVPGNLFYAAVISDPKVSGTMFAGTGFTVHRTKTFGLGTRSREEANRICNSWTGTFEATCGDWEELGTQRLTDASWGSKAGGAVAAIERVATDSSTAWAATSTGRVFLTHNVDAEPASAVTWTRLDDDTPATPNRFVSSITVDPADPDRAWVSFSGFNANTPQTPGHVFEVTVDKAGLSTWADRSFNLGDQPVSDLVRDDPTGDLYASTDFGVLRLSPERNKETWVRAAAGMPNVEVPGLTIVPGSRLLYAASHGMGAWRLDLDENDQDNDDGQASRE